MTLLTPPLADQLQQFCELLQHYIHSQDEELKAELEQLYEEILPQLSENDSRRSSLDYLKGLLE